MADMLTDSKRCIPVARSESTTFRIGSKAGLVLFELPRKHFRAVYPIRCAKNGSISPSAKQLYSALFERQKGAQLIEFIGEIAVRRPALASQRDTG